MDQKTIDTYNRIAEEWHRDHQRDEWWIEGTDTFASFLKPGDLVLDAGCGGGFKSAYLLKKGLKIIGIDASEKMIEIAQRENPTAQFQVLSLQESHKLKEVFAGIFVQASLLHVPKKEALDVVKKLSDKLANGGYLYIAVKNKKENGPNEEIKTETDYGYSYDRFFSYFSIDELKNYLKASGCEVVYENVTPSDNTRWVQVIGKKI